MYYAELWWLTMGLGTDGWHTHFTTVTRGHFAVGFPHPLHHSLYSILLSIPRTVPVQREYATNLSKM